MQISKLIFLFILPSILNAQELSWKQLDSLSKKQYEFGEYHEGLKKTQKCLELLTVENATNERLSVLLRQALFTEKVGFYRKSDTLILEVLHQFRASKLTTHAQYPTALNTAGHIQMLLGNYDSSERFLLQSKLVQEYQKDTISDNYIQSLIYLGLLRMEQKQLDNALIFYLKAEQNTLETKGGNNNIGEIWMHIGEYYLEKEAYTKAEKYLELATTKIKTNTPEYGVLLNHQGRLHNKLADYDEAEIAYNQSLTLKEKFYGENHPVYIRAQINVGLLYYNLGNTSKTLKFLESAQDKYSTGLIEKGLIYADLLNSLGLIYTKQNMHIEKIASLYEKARQQYKQQNNFFKYAITSYNLGDYYFYYASTKEAIPYYQEALNVWKAHGGDNQTYAHYCLGLAQALFTLENFETADSLATIGLTTFRSFNSDNHPDLLYFTSLQAKIKEQKKELENAKEIYINNAILVSKLTTYYYPTLSEGERTFFYSTVKDQLYLISSFLIRHPKSSPRLAVALEELNLVIKGLSLKNTLDARLLSQKNETNEKEFKQLAIIRKTISNLWLLPKKEKRNLNHQLDSLSDTANELEKKINRAINTNFTFENDNFTFEHLIANCKIEEALIDFVVFEYFDGINWTGSFRYAAILMKYNSSAPTIISLTEEAFLEPLLKKKASSENSYIQNHTLNRILFDSIWNPLTPLLKEINSIALAPTGILNKIAFHALKDEKQKYLIKNYELKYYQNLNSIKEKKKGVFKNALLLGGIDYGAEINLNATTRGFEDSLRGNIFSELGATMEEVLGIDSLLNKKGIKSKILSDTLASEQNFRNLLIQQKNSILHLATHGYFFEQQKASTWSKDTGEKRIKTAINPLIRSGLALAGINKAWKSTDQFETNEDGILTAYEISNLNLQNLDLVVLSACDTGLGDFVEGEGIFGLQRAFKLAGVNQLLVSLWKVSDKETKQLMTIFYQYYLSGHSVNKSLRMAQLEMSKNTAAFYWAAFIVI